MMINLLSNYIAYKLNMVPSHFTSIEPLVYIALPFCLQWNEYMQKSSVPLAGDATLDELFLLLQTS